MVKPPAGYWTLAYSSPEPVQTTGTVAVRDSPVALPPSCPKLSTTPTETGSPTATRIWEKFGPGCERQISTMPSEYFKRQCYIALDVDEEPAVDVVNKLGAGYFVVSSDYPHSDGAFPEAIEQFLSLALSGAQRRQILWDNCARLYAPVHQLHATDLRPLVDIRGRNSPALSSPRCCGIMASRSAWTDADAATTTSSSSACGGP